MRKTATLIAIIIVIVAMAAENSFAQNFPVRNLSIRIGRAQLGRGPIPGRPDNPYIPYLVDGYGRVGYINDVTSFVVTGQDVFGGGGVEFPALNPANGRGRWIESLIQTAPNSFWAVFHEERADPLCTNGGVHKSMNIAFGTSPLSFSPVAVIADNGNPCGEGDGTVVHTSDGYYMYLNRASDAREIVVRMNPADPTDWKKYYCPVSGKPLSPDCGFTGVGDEETPIQINPNSLWLGGGAVSSWNQNVVLTGGNNGSPTIIQGIPLLFSSTGFDFYQIPEDPILPRLTSDPDNIFYPSLIDPSQTEGNRLVNGNNLLLFYTYSEAGVVPGGIAPRYLVARTFSMKVEKDPVWPNVGLELSVYLSSFGEYWVTNILPTPTCAWQYDGSLGYVMTRNAKVGGKEEISLYDCMNVDRSHSVNTAACGGGIFLGYAFRDLQAGTHAVYECVLTSGKTFFSLASDCSGKGAASGEKFFLLDQERSENPPATNPMCGGNGGAGSASHDDDNRERLGLRNDK